MVIIRHSDMVAIFKDRQSAEELQLKYPWFDAPARFLSQEVEQLPARIRLSEQLRINPRAVCEPEAHNKAVNELFDIPEAGAMSIIDEFINRGEYRIKTTDTTPEDIETNTTEELLPDDDLLTEELAKVYMAQGLTQQAIEIYRRLSLLNPEKSVYFAEIIAKTESQGSKN